MAEKYSPEAYQEMTDRQLRKEKAYLEQLLVVWTFFDRGLPEAVRGYHELGNDKLSVVLDERHRRLAAAAIGTERVIQRIDEELAKRGVLA